MTKIKGSADALLPTHASQLLQRASRLVSGLTKHAGEISPKYQALLDATELAQTGSTVAQALQVQQDATATKRAFAQRAKELLTAEIAAVKVDLTSSTTRLEAIATEVAAHEAALQTLRAESKQLHAEAKAVRASRVQTLRNRSTAELASKVTAATDATAALRASYTQLSRQYQELLNIAEANFASTENAAALVDLMSVVPAVVASANVATQATVASATTEPLVAIVTDTAPMPVAEPVV